MRRRWVQWGKRDARFWGLALIDTRPLVGFKIGLTYSWRQRLVEFTLIFICLRIHTGYHFMDPKAIAEEFDV